MPGAVYIERKKNMTREVIGPREESICVILLNGHVVTLPSKYLFIAVDMYCSQLWLKNLLIAVGSD